MLDILMRAGSFISIIVLGFFLKRIGFFKQEDFSILSKITIRITLPASIIAGFAGKTLDPSMLIFLLLGMVMDTGPAIVILAPVLLPAVEQLGVQEVHFGVLLVCCLSIGLATPPFGLDLFVAGSLSEEPPMAIAKEAFPFIIAFLAALAVITYIPWFSLALI